MSFIGRIYKISTNETNNIYIGSTVKPLYEALRLYKRSYSGFKRGKESCNYSSCFDVIETGKPNIELIEEKEFETKKEMKDRQFYYIQNMENVVNKIQHIMTEEEKKNKQKEKVLKNQKEKITKPKKTDTIICICGSKCLYTHKQRHEKSVKHINFVLNEQNKLNII
jgi:hypothetical protein